jgi:RNA polymerase sigma-70 factor (ECF subfamily)
MPSPAILSGRDDTNRNGQVHATIMSTTTAHELGREALSHADALYNHARRLTRNDADAEELVQETYARALAGAQTFMGGHLKAWLFTIMRNVFLDLQRRGRHQPAVGQLDVIDGAGERLASSDSQEVDRLQGLVGSEIEAALATLSDGARAIILLDVEGFTETEVAEVLGCALGTVKSRLARARGLLREKLKEHAPSPRWRRDPSTGDR